MICFLTPFLGLQSRHGSILTFFFQYFVQKSDIPGSNWGTFFTLSNLIKFEFQLVTNYNLFPYYAHRFPSSDSIVINTS